jgi:hypothetical protein
MAAIRQQRCLHHPTREAAARCPECGRHFCRECVVEHDDRVLCAACLRRLAAVAAPKRARLRPLFRVAAALCGFVMLWIAFYLCGQLLLAVPSSFHEGTIWRAALGEE